MHRFAQASFAALALAAFRSASAIFFPEAHHNGSSPIQNVEEKGNE
jgi:hypothetical protein